MSTERPKRNEADAPGEQLPRFGRLAALSILLLLLTNCGLLDPTGRTGRVVDPAGVPIAGVTVSASDAGAVTDGEGRWSLVTRQALLTYRKPGYKAATLPVESVKEARLAPADGPVKVVWDDRWAGPPTDGITAWLNAHGAPVTAVKSGASLPEGDVYVLCAPAYSSQAAQDEFGDRIRAGATVLLAGEWGGASRIDLGALAGLGQGAGIRFDGSLVRDPAALGNPDWIAPEFLVAGLAPDAGVKFAGSGALGVVPPALLLARSGVASYRVSQWSRGPQVLAAYGPLGAGKVVAIADASWLTDAHTFDPAKPNWQAAGNSALALALSRF